MIYHKIEFLLIAIVSSTKVSKNQNFVPFGHKTKPVTDYKGCSIVPSAGTENDEKDSGKNSSFTCRIHDHGNSKLRNHTTYKKVINSIEH